MPPREKPIKKYDVLKDTKQAPKYAKAPEKPANSRPVVAAKKYTISKAEVLKKAEDAKRLREEKERKRYEEEMYLLLELERQRYQEEEEARELERYSRGGKRTTGKKDKYAELGAAYNLQIFGAEMTDEQRRMAGEELAQMMSGGPQCDEETIRAKQQERYQRKAEKAQQAALEQATKAQKVQEDWEQDLGGHADGFSDFADEPEDAAQGSKSKKAVAAEPSEFKLKDNELRSPIVCVLGHVDTGKTSLLDKIRESTVQAREEGGITQQIGASFLSDAFIKAKTENFPKKFKIEVPGLLIVDTPGHESFANLRSRGSSLADLTILVVDINHGIEAQTIESINLLKYNKTPFIIALNKIDRLYDWKSYPSRDSKASLDAQSKPTRNDFEKKYNLILKQFGELEYTLDFWWNVRDVNDTVPVVPTSAITGEGLSDLLAMLVTFSYQLMRYRITYTSETQCTILEVRKTEGFGYTLDCILVNGILRRGWKIVCAGQEGPISTVIQAILTPKEAKEIREASTYDYERHEQLQAAVGCKIAAKDLELAVAGTPIYIAENDEEEEALKEAVMAEIQEYVSAIRADLGVHVNSSSMGALEALVGYLRSENTQTQRIPVPISGASIGPVTKQIVYEVSIYHERYHPEYAVILAFDVNVDKEVKEKAKELGVRIFENKIIYRLYDMYWDSIRQWHQEERERLKADIVYPAVLQCIAVFHTHDPMICGFRVISGTLHFGMPLALEDREGGKYIGRVAGMYVEHKDIQEAYVGYEVAVRIDSYFAAGKDGLFDMEDFVYTKITRKSIDIMKLHFRDELEAGWGVVIKAIKTKLYIQ